MEQEYNEFGPNFLTQHFEYYGVRRTASDMISNVNNLREDIDETRGSVFHGQSVPMNHVVGGCGVRGNLLHERSEPRTNSHHNFAHSSSLSAKKLILQRLEDVFSAGSGGQRF